MPINSGYRETDTNIIKPIDYATWEHLGNSSGSHFTITDESVTGTMASFSSGNAGFFRIQYDDALRLANRTEWSIEAVLRINSTGDSSTSSLTEDACLIAQGASASDSTGDSTAIVDWGVFISPTRDLKFVVGITDSTETISVKTFSTQLPIDDTFTIRISYNDSTKKLKMRLNNETAEEFTVQEQDQISNSQRDLAIGGLEGGNNLKAIDIVGIQIRRADDIISTTKSDVTEPMINPNNHQYLHEAPTDGATDVSAYYTYSAWDVDTLFAVFSPSENLPRQTLLIPQTWDEWTSWNVAPKSTLEITTSDINYKNETLQGVKNIEIFTTDGFVYPYGVASSAAALLDRYPAWSSGKSYFSYAINNNVTSDTASHHDLGGDVEWRQSFWKPKLVRSETFTGTTNYNLILPTRGYVPAEEVVAYDAAIDTTKVDDVSKELMPHISGSRPRGLLKVQYQINEGYVEDVITATPSQERFYIGLPYYETTVSGTTYENGWYNTVIENVSDPQFNDTDFRFGNSNIVHIKSISLDSAYAWIIETKTSHDLTTGDQVYIRPGQFHNDSTDSRKVAEAYDNLARLCWVQTIDSTTFKVYADSGRTNVIDAGYNVTSTTEFAYGYVVKTSSVTGAPTLEDTNYRRTHYVKPFSQITSIQHPGLTSIGAYTQEKNYVNYPAVSRAHPDSTKFDDALIDSQWRTATDGNTYDNTDSYGVANATQTVYTIPTGSSTSKFVSTIKDTGHTHSDAGRFVLEVDVKGSGNLKFQLDNIEVADSSTPNARYYVRQAGIDTDASDDTETFTFFTTDAYTEQSVAVAPDSTHGSNTLNPILLIVKLDNAHSTSGDVTQYQISVWFEGDDNNSQMFFAGGYQPGRSTRFDKAKPNPGLSAVAGGTNNYMLYRKRNHIIYESGGTAIRTINGVSQYDITVRGIPDIVRDARGGTFLATSNQDPPYAQDPLDSSAVTYLDNVINLAERVDKSSIVFPAPWQVNVSYSTGDYVLYEGHRYLYTSTQNLAIGDTFWQQYQQGIWTRQ